MCFPIKTPSIISIGSRPPISLGFMFAPQIWQGSIRIHEDNFVAWWYFWVSLSSLFECFPMEFYG